MTAHNWPSTKEALDTKKVEPEKARAVIARARGVSQHAGIPDRRGASAISALVVVPQPWLRANVPSQD